MQVIDRDWNNQLKSFLSDIIPGESIIKINQSSLMKLVIS